MTYKELVDNIKATVDGHLILKDFGYGAITDIKTVAEGTRVDYPYAFLNPTQSSRTGQTITYRFNLIVMDVVQEDPTNGFVNYLKVQSDCQQYIDDILADLRFKKPLKDFDLTLNVNLTPFKERFQDTLAGMTATLEIEIPSALNDCITPTRGSEIVTYSYRQNVIIEPDPFGGVIPTETPAYDPQDLWHDNGGAYYYEGLYLDNTITKTYRVEVTGTAQATELKPIPSTPRIGLNPITVQDPATPPTVLITYTPIDESGWPVDQTSTQSFNWSAVYQFTTPITQGSPQQPDLAVTWQLSSGADPGDDAQIQFLQSEIKVYEL